MSAVRKEINLLFLLFIIPWTVYFVIIWSKALQVTPSGWYSAYLPHWGDGAAHLSYMSAFAYRDVFPTKHPLFAGHPFTYSFAADMMGGLFTRVGLPLWFSYNMWGFILSILTLIAIWKLIKTFTKSNVVTLLVGYLFLFSGGLGWRYLILDKLNPSNVPEVSYFPLLYTQREASNLVWLNVIVGELIPQRAFLLAIPLASFLLYFWYQQFIEYKKYPLWLYLVQGIILGCMPVIHPHTTMVLISVLGVWLVPSLVIHLFKYLNDPKVKFPLIWKQAISIGVPALFIGLFLTTQFLVPSVSSGFFKFYPGWIARSKDVNWLLFWFDNWGLFLPLAAIGTIFLTNKKLKLILAPFWVWFGLANLFLFQPYDWDNSKLLTWVYLAFCIPVALILMKLWQKSLVQKIMAIALCIVVTLAGAIDAFRMLDTSTYKLELVNAEEVQLASEVKSKTPPHSTILTATYHDNWVPILTGRQILAGYLGWMWTYGIDAGERVTDMKAMFAGTSQAELLFNKYSIDYVVIGPQEKAEFKVNETFFASRYKAVISSPSTTIYEIN